MKKYVLTIIASLLIGFLLANFMLKQYDQTAKIIPTYKGNETIYMIQQGVYSSAESMKENTVNIPYYIYTQDNNLYYVYIAMSLDTNNITKLQTYYQNLGIKTIVKSMTSTNEAFVQTLKQCDDILKNTDDPATIKEVINQGLSKYEGS